MKQQKNQLSPEKYIRTRARTLPIGECWVNDNWQEAGMANIIVARKHVTGNLTLGIYLVDTFALGVKNTFFRFNIRKEDYNELVAGFKENFRDTNGSEYVRTEYAEVHNIIYGANAFAEDNDFKPCEDFELTQYILEEDDDRIELIEYEFGKDGKPFLIY
jgi:hypothetical protein